MSARKHTYLTLRDKVRLIKAVESDDDDTSDSLSVIKKYSFRETMITVSVFKNFTADRGLDDILHSICSILWINYKTHVIMKSTGQQSSIN